MAIRYSFHSRNHLCLANRRGQALVEFAIISFVLSAMLAGMLGIMVMALGSFQNNIAAESAGRVLNKVLDYDLADASEVYTALATGPSPLYEERHLILTPSEFYDSAFKASLPPINRMLLSNFVFDVDRNQYRHPGAVVINADGDETVLIPLLPSASLGAANGIDRADSVSTASSFPVALDWVAPVTVADVFPPLDPTAADPPPRSCTIAFFYPSQPGSMIDLEQTFDSEGRAIFQDPVVADDSSLSLSGLPTGYSFAPPVPSSGIASTSRGQFGLGESFAFTISVRPFRLVFETATTFQLEDAP